jgi:hypothetical protein
MTTLAIIGYDITDTDKDVNQAKPQPVYFDSDENLISCEAYDYIYSIGVDEQFESLESFIEKSTKEGWFKVND